MIFDFLIGQPNRSSFKIPDQEGKRLEPFDGAQGRLIEQLERASVFDSANHVQVNVHETTSAKRRNKWQEGALVRPEIRALPLSGQVHNLLLRGSAGTRAPWLNDGKVSYESSATSSDQFYNCRGKTPSCTSGKPNKNDAACSLHPRVD